MSPADAGSGTAVGALGAAWPRALVAEVSLVAAARVDSTQRLARTLLDRHFREEEDPRPFAVLALEQSAGRGRQGRSWESAAGLGLWGSVAIGVPAAGVQTLPMRVAAALAETVNASIGDHCRLKWPNDLVVGRGKLGGLLIDAVGGPQSAAWAVIGFGINHGHTAAELPVPGAISMRVAVGGRPLPSLAAFAAAAVAAVRAELADPDSGWLARYRSLSAHAAGDELACELADEKVAGRFAGFDDHGFLVLDTAGGRRTVRSGEVFAW